MSPLQPGGTRHRRNFFDPGGVTDISRGLRSVSDDTPGSRRERIPYPGGMPDKRDSVSKISLGKISESAYELCPFESLI
jgi:hypothetical protein